MEYSLPSGDSIDVAFRHRDLYVGVEVKSHISTEADHTRGLFQCVKYQAVLEAMLGCLGEPQSVRVVLALDRPLPESLSSLRNTLGVEVVNVKE